MPIILYTAAVQGNRPIFVQKNLIQLFTYPLKALMTSECSCFADLFALFCKSCQTLKGCNDQTICLATIQKIAVERY